VRKVFVVSALVIGTAVQLFAAQSPLTLVRDGEAQSVIVTADKPSSSARDAARDLQMWIEKTGGAKLAIRRESDVRPSDGVRILVGASEATAKLGIDPASFELEEICIHTYPDILVVMGDDKRPDGVTLKGTVWAVGTLAEQQLGVRVLWPSELGLVVPKKSTIEIGELDFRFVPVLRKRITRNIGYSDHIQRGLDKLGWSADEFKRHARESDV
jgi:hypothetical protein